MAVVKSARIGDIVVFNAGDGLLQPAVVTRTGYGFPDAVDLCLFPSDDGRSWAAGSPFLKGVRHGRDVGWWRFVEDEMFPLLPGESW